MLGLARAGPGGRQDSIPAPTWALGFLLARQLGWSCGCRWPLTQGLAWLLPPPSQPDCHLHLHLRWADNPYVSGTVHTKDTAPGLIMGAGR